MALSEFPTTQELQELATKYANVEITVSDSIAAGNCVEGTDEFIEEYFEGRESATVSELIQYIDAISGVRIVLTHKFRILEDAEPNLDAHPF